MKFALDPAGTQYLVKCYTPEHISINDTDYTNSVIVSPTTLLDNWRPQTFTELQAQDFEPILQLKPDIFILGVGTEHQFPAPHLLQTFYQHHIGVEVMTTAAACRTFNVLASEGRTVVAGLLRG